jgi:hypothetical protein
VHRFGFAAIGCSAVVAACPAIAGATSFTFTGSEQTYTVPAGVTNVTITAIGGAGGTPASGTGLPGGRGASVTGIVAVSPGQVLYVHVAGPGDLSAGGYNGGGAGGDTGMGVRVWGGGGASDVRTAPESVGAASLDSRLIVAAGGGGSAGIAAGGGDAGAPGWCCGAAATGPNTAQPGSQTAGGAGGCDPNLQNCGGPGTLGRGGNGGASGMGFDQRAGGGGGGGLYGGGGGAGGLLDTGGGAGGSSKIPAGGSVAASGLAAQITIDPYTPPPPTATPSPTPTATPAPAAPKSMSTALTYRSSVSRRKRTTRLSSFRVKGIPPGSTVVARCLTCKGKRGRAVTTKPTGSIVAIKSFDRTWSAGTRLEAVVSSPGYITQIKTLVVRRGKAPRVTTLCQAPGATKRARC